MPLLDSKSLLDSELFLDSDLVPVEKNQSYTPSQSDGASAQDVPASSSNLVSAQAFGMATPTSSVAATSSQNINALLTGVKWASATVTFSFTDDYSETRPIKELIC
jgi:hypothetical protein